jgi:UDP-glucose 4-epimerase
MGEYYCQIFFNLYGLETVSLRYFNVFGPRQDPHSIYSAVIPKFIAALLESKPPVIYGDGNQSRDFTYVENVVKANLLSMETPGVTGQVLNIACGQQTSVNVLLSMLRDLSGEKISPRHESPRTGEVRHSLASIDLAKSLLRYEVKIGIQKGLLATWDWFQKKKISEGGGKGGGDAVRNF